MPRPSKALNLTFIVVLVAVHASPVCNCAIDNDKITAHLHLNQQPYKSATSVSSFKFPAKFSPNHLPPIYPDPARARPIHPSLPTPSSVAHLALEGGYVYFARLLVEQCADVNIRKKHKWTLIHLASKGGRVDFVRLLVEYGAEVNARNNYQ